MQMGCCSSKQTPKECKGALPDQKLLRAILIDTIYLSTIREDSSNTTGTCSGLDILNDISANLFDINDIDDYVENLNTTFLYFDVMTNFTKTSSEWLRDPVGHLNDHWTVLSAVHSVSPPFIPK